MPRKRRRPLHLGQPEELRCPQCGGAAFRVIRRLILPAGGNPMIQFHCEACGETRSRGDLDGSWFPPKDPCDA